MIERESLDGVEVVRLARGKVNALDLELVTAITETFTSLGQGSAQPIVLTGSGRAFSADVVSRAVEAARRLAGSIPAAAYQFTKWQLRHEVNERLGRLRPEQDRMVAQLWEAGLRDGAIGSYMERLSSH
ncbi:MAG: hypothetical protein ACRDT6_22000 [Micromonosporaceae bacterium]